MILEATDLAAEITSHAWDSAPHKISFKISDGGIVAIVGARSTSKSAMILALGDLIPDPVDGKVSGRIDRGASIQLSQANKPSVLTQDAIEWTVSASVFGEIAFALENTENDVQAIRAKVVQTAILFGLEDKLEANPQELSGGQKQRLAIAAQLARSPKLICFDEPYRGLDVEGAIAVTEILNRLRSMGHSIVVTGSQVVPEFEELEISQFIFLHDGMGTPLASLTELREFSAKQSVGKQPYFWGQSLVEERFEPTGELGSLKPRNRDGLPELNIKDARITSYGRFVLGPLSLERHGPGVTAVLGANGSGKTSFAKFVAWRQATSFNGKVVVRGQRKRRTAVYYLSQDSARHFSKQRCVDELLLLGVPLTQARLLLSEYGISDVELLDPLLIARPKQQLLALSVAEASGMDILFLDEPTACLDANGHEAFTRCLARYRSAGRRVFLITHDANLAEQVSDDVIVFDSGNIRFDGSFARLVQRIEDGDRSFAMSFRALRL